MSHVRTFLGKLALVAVLVTAFGAVAGRPAGVHALDPGVQGATPVYRYWLPSTQDWESVPAGGDQPTAADMIASGYSQFPTPQYYVDLVGNPDMVAVYRWWQPKDQDWVDIVDGSPSDATMTSWGYQQKTFEWYAYRTPPAGATNLVAVYRWWQPTTTDWMTVADGEISDADMTAAGYTSKTFLFYAWPASSRTAETGYFSTGQVAHSIIQDPDQPIHTLSVLDVNSAHDPKVNEGYRFLGYYGHVLCKGIGIARSNDLVNWVKDPNPPFSGEEERWASALADGDVIDLAYNIEYCTDSANYPIMGRTSTDGSGTTFKGETTLVAESDHPNGNPSLFRDPVSKRIFLYWFRLNGSISEIHVKSGATFADLETPSDLGTVIAQSPMTVAAPNVLFFDGTYYLAVETKESTVWKTRVLTSTSPTGPFSEVPGNPLYLSGAACVSQNVVDGVLHSFYCHQDTPGNQTDNWTLDETTAPLPSS